MEIFLYILLGVAGLSFGLFLLFQPKSDGRTKTGTKDNEPNAPGCLLGFALIVGLLAWLLSWLTGTPIL